MHYPDDVLLAGFGPDRPRPISASARPIGQSRIIVRMPDVAADLVVTSRVTVPAAELRWRFSRSSGPGGQGVNTTDSRVELSFDVVNCSAFPELLRDRLLARLADRLVDGVIVVAASEHRSQLRNREAATTRLTALLRDALAPPPRPRRPTMPSRGAIERRLNEKKANARRKADRRTPDDR
jgi:ribosome-associated protein